MKLKLTLTVIITLLAVLYFNIATKANSAARGWCEYGDQTVSVGGLTSSTVVQKSYPACTITVFNAGTSDMSVIYSDNAGSPTPLANPFTAQSNGSWKFYAAAGLYDVVLSGGGLPTSFTLSGVSLFDSTAITTINVSGAISAGYVTLTGVLFSALGTPANGTMKYCSDCVVASTCAGSGDGAIAKRLNGAWTCN
ncbi:MAG: hypothetical protein ACREJN_21315 [Nitrospiraceae bacterium]